MRKSVILLIIIIIGIVGFIAVHYLMAGQLPLALCTQCH